MTDLRSQGKVGPNWGGGRIKVRGCGGEEDRRQNGSLKGGFMRHRAEGAERPRREGSRIFLRAHFFFFEGAELLLPKFSIFSKKFSTVAASVGLVAPYTKVGQIPVFNPNGLLLNALRAFLKKKAKKSSVPSSLLPFSKSSGLSFPPSLKT